MKEKYFENVYNLGDLYLEKSFMKFEDEDILFICKDEKGERYLGVCYELRYALKWVLCKVTKEMILRMLVNNITVYECFRKANRLLLISYTEEAGEKSEWTTYGKIEKRILPDKDFYFKYNMERDVYYLYICHEMFKETRSLENYLKLDTPPFIQEMMTRQAVCTANNSFVIRNRKTHSVLERNANKEWMNYCA